MKKRIFIFNYYMEVGGVERSLLGLLNSIDYSKYEVDLFIARHTGEFMSLIPNQVNLIPEVSEYALWAVPMRTVIKAGYYSIAASRVLARCKSIFFRRFQIENVDDISEFCYIADFSTPFMPCIKPEKEYDLAISFIAPHHSVLKKVNAKKKIAWIHTDYSSIGIDVKSEEKVWGAFDYIASISDSVTEGFLKRFPALEPKIRHIENILSPDFVRQQAELETIQLEGELRFLTVARFSYQKNIEGAVRICKALVDRGVPVKWYVVGYGDEAPIHQTIEECGMHDHFFILGKKPNPYPYMKACDLYVQPSRYEGKAVTVREAQMLHKPVVITAFPTSQSQLKDGFDGVIVPMDAEAAADAIVELLNDKQRMEQLVQNMKSTDYGNESEVNKIYDLIG
ncbi:MAG: glycosyltransferase [Bacteroidales bacterium]